MRIMTRASHIMLTAFLLPAVASFAFAARGARPEALDPFPSVTARGYARMDTVATAAVPADVRALSDTQAPFLAPTPRHTLRRACVRFEDDVAGCRRTGCAVYGSGFFSALGESVAIPPDTLKNFLEARGWQEIFDYSADGPDGTRYALRRGGLLCVVQGFWRHEDSDDPTYVDPDDYAILVQLARAEPCAPPRKP